MAKHVKDNGVEIIFPHHRPAQGHQCPPFTIELPRPVRASRIVCSGPFHQKNRWGARQQKKNQKQACMALCWCNSQWPYFAKYCAPHLTPAGESSPLRESPLTARQPRCRTPSDLCTRVLDSALKPNKNGILHPVSPTIDAFLQLVIQRKSSRVVQVGSKLTAPRTGHEQRNQLPSIISSMNETAIPLGSE